MLKLKKESTKIDKKNLENYIHVLETEKIHLEGEIKTLNRQTNRIKSSFLEPIRNIVNILDYEMSDTQKLNIINTQLNNFFVEKNLQIYKPIIGEKHDKTKMIVEDTIITANIEDIDKIECVISVGLLCENEIILPARVRVYKGE